MMMAQEGGAPAFVWKIKNFSKLRSKKLYSEVFIVGGNKWRLLVIPEGNEVYDHLSLYLSAADSSPLSAEWSTDTTEWFSLTIINQISCEKSIAKAGMHRFDDTENNWGFESFMSLAELHDPAAGYLIDDTLVVQADFCSAPPIVIKVSRDEDLTEQIGKSICFDIVDHDKVCSFQLPNVTPFRMFKDEVAKEFGIPVKFLRFWSWVERGNKTYRPDRCLTPQDEEQSVEELRLSLRQKGFDSLNLFLEVEVGLNLCPIAPPAKTEDDILIFFKLYDPKKHALRYVGRLFVKKSGLPIEILAKLNQMAGFAYDEETELYEEIKFSPSSMCVHVDKKISFHQSRIGDGDIIWVQRSLSPRVEKQFLYPDVPSFLEYALNRVTLVFFPKLVHFRSLDKPREDVFCLELSKLDSYSEVTQKVANELGVDDPSQVWLTSHNCNSQQPEPQTVKRTRVKHLSDLLVRYNQTSDILYYEVLDMPFPQLKGARLLKVDFRCATKDAVVFYTIRVLKSSTAADIISKLKTTVELSHPNAALRLLEILDHKIHKIFCPTDKINNPSGKLRAEEIPEAEKNLGLYEWSIHVYHFTTHMVVNQMHAQNFGEPFFLVIHEYESLGEVKLRLREKLKAPDEEFAKWRFAFVSLGRIEYLHSSDIVFACFKKRDVYIASEKFFDLGLEHSSRRPVDTTPSVGLPASSRKLPDTTPSVGLLSSKTLPEITPSAGLAASSRTPPDTTPVGLPASAMRPPDTTPSVGLPTSTRRPLDTTPSGGLPTSTRRPSDTTPSAGFAASSRTPPDTTPVGFPASAMKPLDTTPSIGLPMSTRRPPDTTHVDLSASSRTLPDNTPSVGFPASARRLLDSTPSIGLPDSSKRMPDTTTVGLPDSSRKPQDTTTVGLPDSSRKPQDTTTVGLPASSSRLQDTIPTVSLPDSSMSSRSSSAILENLRSLLAGISSTGSISTQSNASSSGVSSEPSQPPYPQTLQSHRRSLQNFLASALEDIEQADGFDEINTISLVLIQHSSNALEKTILKDLVDNLSAFKEMVLGTKACMEDVRAQMASLREKKVEVGTRLDKALQRFRSLETELSKVSKEEKELKARVSRTKKEELLIRKNSLAIELERFNEEVTKDVEGWKVIMQESEEASYKWLKTRQTQAHGNLSWKLFKQNLEQCQRNGC